MENASQLSLNVAYSKESSYRLCVSPSVLQVLKKVQIICYITVDSCVHSSVYCRSFVISWLRAPRRKNFMVG